MPSVKLAAKEAAGFRRLMAWAVENNIANINLW